MSLFSINKVTLVGNITREPEVRYTNNGTTVISLSVATNRSIKTQNGYDDETCFHMVKIWGSLGENVAKKAVKGDPIVIEGRINNYSYDAKDGTKKYMSEIVAEKAIVFDRKARQATSEPDNSQELNQAADELFGTKDEGLPF